MLSEESVPLIVCVEQIVPICLKIRNEMLPHVKTKSDLNTNATHTICVILLVKWCEKLNKTLIRQCWIYWERSKLTTSNSLGASFAALAGRSALRLDRRAPLFEALEPRERVSSSSPEDSSSLSSSLTSPVISYINNVQGGNRVL